MFDILKKKLSSFSQKLKQTIEKKQVTASATEEKAPRLPEKEFDKGLDKEIEKMEKIEEGLEEEVKAGEEVAETIEEKPVAEAVEEKTLKARAEAEKAVEATEEKTAVKKKGLPFAEKARELKARLGLKAKIKKAILGETTIEEKDIKSLLEELELALLEADVEQEAAAEIAGEIKKDLVGKKLSRGEDASRLFKSEIKKSLEKAMQAKQVDLLAEAKKKKPFVIMFLGPNGAGKTTSIAKLARLLQKKGKSSVWSASDTFRSASIEQLEKHAEKLGVRVIKHKYGADPAAVAFDAVKAAEAKRIDAVLIDTAGRQETNKNLMEELKKIARVAKPDLKIFVGEALAGQALLQQAEEFDSALGLDGFILTKIDCDAKGGTTISLIFKLKKPVLFVGTGQGYDDLVEFSPEFIIERVVG